MHARAIAMEDAMKNGGVSSVRRPSPTHGPAAIDLQIN